MSRYANSARMNNLAPYVPGEQPRTRGLVKLNTNESPFPPAPGVREAAAEAAARANLYCDPECRDLRQAAAALYGLQAENVLPTNGSDEALFFAFTAYGGPERTIAFPDVTYGFYQVLARITHTRFHILPLEEDFSLSPVMLENNSETTVFANPNAPTGLALRREQIESVLRKKKDQVLLVDEAYVDFGGESCVPLIPRYDNLLVVTTFSKSRSLAGARLGFALGQASLLEDLRRIKDSINPYNVSAMTQAAGMAAIARQDVTEDNCRAVMETRAWTAAALEELGFTVLPSMGNFLFVKNPLLSGEAMLQALRERNVLVRHFSQPRRIEDYLRITVGSREQMEILLRACREILHTEGGA